MIDKFSLICNMSQPCSRGTYSLHFFTFAYESTDAFLPALLLTVAGHVASRVRARALAGRWCRDGLLRHRRCCGRRHCGLGARARSRLWCLWARTALAEVSLFTPGARSRLARDHKSRSAYFSDRVRDVKVCSISISYK